MITAMLLLLAVPTDSHAFGRHKAGTEPGLSASLRADIHASVAASDAAKRQATIDSVMKFVRAELKLPIRWNTVASVTYDGDNVGSMTDSTDPSAIRVTIGRDAFNCDGDVYSTIRHELVHVGQHQDQAAALKRGWGIQEIYAYLWELDHAAETGLDKCDRKDENGDWNPNYGVARGIDGVLRYASRLDEELATKSGDISPAELKAVSEHVACALKQHASMVRKIFPELEWDQLPATPNCAK